MLRIYVEQGICLGQTLLKVVPCVVSKANNTCLTKFYKIVLFARQLNPQFSSCQLRYMIFRRDVECVQKILNSKCRKRFKSPRKIQKYSLHNSSTGDRSLNSIYLKSHPNVFLPFCNYSVLVFTFSTNLWKYRKVFSWIFGFQ